MEAVKASRPGLEVMVKKTLVHRVMEGKNSLLESMIEKISLELLAKKSKSTETAPGILTATTMN